MSSEPFFLTPNERETVLWKRLSTHLEARVAALRAQNDNDHSPEATAKLRGRIAEARAMLALGQEKPEFASPGLRKPAG